MESQRRCIQSQCPFPQHQMPPFSTYKKGGAHLCVLLLLGTLDLCCSPERLLSVLALLALLSAGLLDLAGQSNTNQSVVRLELLQGIGRIVDESETGCLATTELGLETEHVDLGNGRLVHLSELCAEVILGDVCAVGVKNVDNHLLSAQKRVTNELARAQRYGLVGQQDREAQQTATQTTQEQTKDSPRYGEGQGCDQEEG